MDHVVSVLIISPQGVPLIRDLEKPSPVYWKLPGGHALVGETPPETAVREVKEETGISLKAEELRSVYEEDRDSHCFFLFQTIIDSLKGLKSAGAEEVKMFMPRAIKTMPDFFPPHREILEKIKYF